MPRRFEKFSQALRQSIFFLALCNSFYTLLNFIPLTISAQRQKDIEECKMYTNTVNYVHLIR